MWETLGIIGTGLAVGIAIGIAVSNWMQRLQKDAANKSADKIRDEAKREAEHTLREARVSAKSEVLKMRDEWKSKNLQTRGVEHLMQIYTDRYKKISDVEDAE